MKQVHYPWFTFSFFIDKMINRRFCIPSKVNKDVKIFVSQHFKTELPQCFSNRAVYVPIDCGRASHIALTGMIGDDLEPSISKLNPFLNEMTTIYWVGKHYHEIGNPEYVGFMHYRRYLDWSPRCLGKQIVFASLIVTRNTTRQFFINYHGEKWLNVFLNEFLVAFGHEEYKNLNRFLNSHFLYIANNFIIHREMFFEYFGFTEKCLSICVRLLEKHNQEFAAMSIIGKRQFSYIMERMTSYWIWREKKRGVISVVSSRLRCFVISNGMTKIRGE